MVVSRMKLRGSSVRFVVVSATVPNIQDVADWVGSPSGDGPATVKEVCELKVLRPVGLSDRAISSEKSSGRASCRNSCTAFLGARTRTTLSLQRHSTTSCTACCNSIATTSQFLCSALLAKVITSKIVVHVYVTFVLCSTGVMIAAEQIIKEYEEAGTKRESLPWSKPPRSATASTDRASCSYIRSGSRIPSLTSSSIVRIEYREVSLC